MKRGTVFILLGVLLLLAAAGYAGHNIYRDRKSSAAADEVVEALAAEMEAAQQASENTDETEQPDEAGQNPEQTGEAAADSSIQDITENTADTEDYSYALWELYPEMEMPTITISGYRYIGILEIPSRSLKLPVMEEWDLSRLDIAPCRYCGSAYQDDMVICGHNYSGHFSEIRYIGVGETVYFTDVDGNLFTYIVDNVETLNPSQVEDMITGDWDLTLFTCNTGARTRRAVRCYRVKD